MMHSLSKRKLYKPLGGPTMFSFPSAIKLVMFLRGAAPQAQILEGKASGVELPSTQSRQSHL